VDELEKLYGKGLLNQIKQGNVLLSPNIPQSKPKRLPLSTSLPDNAQAASSITDDYVCPKCKKSFNSKDELELHMETNHKSRKIPAQQ